VRPLLALHVCCTLRLGIPVAKSHLEVIFIGSDHASLRCHRVREKMNPSPLRRIVAIKSRTNEESRTEHRLSKYARTPRRTIVPTTKPQAPPSNARAHDSNSRKPMNHIQPLKYGILSISSAPEDHNTLRDILNDSPWQIVRSRTCKEAIARLCRQHIPVVICDSDLPDGTWRDVLNRINTLTHRPVLIVTSRLADDYLWAEVLNLGGYNVLAKPFRESEVKHVVASLRMQGHRQARQTAGAGAA
jgi:PleD family two-component response regulator